jgi:hypothetical protein
VYASPVTPWFTFILLLLRHDIRVEQSAGKPTGHKLSLPDAVDSFRFVGHLLARQRQNGGNAGAFDDHDTIGVTDYEVARVYRCTTAGDRPVDPARNPLGGAAWIRANRKDRISPLAQYDAIRRAGHDSTIGERDQQVGSVACPIVGLNQTLIGCAAVSGTVARFTPAACKLHLRALRKAAGALTFELGSLLSGSITRAEWNQPPDFAHAAVQRAR